MAGTWVTIDLSAVIKSSGTYSFALKGLNSTAIRFDSKEAVNKPNLEIDVSNSPVVMAAGDISCTTAQIRSAKYCHETDTAALLGPADKVLMLGDMQYDNGDLTSIMAKYDKSWGVHKSKTIPAVGNHEYKTSGASGYYTYWGAQGTGVNGKGYYSTNVGSWHIIILNSNCTVAGGCSSTSPQSVWLQNDLVANAGAKCTLVAFHHPRYSSGDSHGSSTSYTSIWQILYNNKADIVLSGHDHSYERFAPMNANAVVEPTRGIRSFVVGSGGKEMRAFRNELIPPTGAVEIGSEAQNSHTYGVLKLTLNDGIYNWQFLPEAGKTWTDTGTGNCVQ